MRWNPFGYNKVTIIKDVVRCIQRVIQRMKSSEKSLANIPG